MDRRAVFFLNVALQSADPLNVSLVNHFLTNDYVTVTFQWPKEDGAINLPC